MSIVIKNIKKKFGDFVAVDDISLQVNEGEFVGLLGPSGSGKTTLLRIIAGLEVQDEGEIYLEGADAAALPIRGRRIGFVFQHFALFKHMTVFENIAFGLRLKRPKIAESDIQSKVESLLKLIHLEGSGFKYPSELSGGQQQRVSLARVLAIEPKYMLLDEPFGALDSKVRKELRRWLKKLHDSEKLTTIFVTHDHEEAMEISDKIAIIENGKVEQIGTPLEIWENPVNAFVFDFLGNYNTFFGYEDEDQKLIINLDYIRENIKSFSSEKYIRALSRSHQVLMERSPDDTKYFLKVKVTLINKAGSLIKIEAESHLGSFFLMDMDATKFESLNPQLGEELWIRPEYYRSFSEKV
jgi:sulfate transport system ATP-binding protein